MLQRKTLASLALIVALAAVPAIAADEPQKDPHHPAASAPAAAPAAPTPGGMGSGMMGGGMMGGNMPMMEMMSGMMGQGGMRKMAEHVEGWIAFLKTELKITDAQLALWNPVAEAMRANAKTGMSMMDGMGSGTLPDRLAAREKMMAAHLDALRKFKSAVDPLYATLTDDQKKTADEELMSPMGMM